ncbi:MAG: hypothetical protein FGM15_00755 [Chthoniobacterales bacterium]|nr:hypothetical protein [Chthoniobacterales bacterium]
MDAFVTFALSNFPLTFTVLGLIAAGVQILKTPAPRPRGRSAEAVLRWFLFFGIGVTFFYNFVCHVFFGDMAAKFIGWAQSPFQAEVGWASLGYAVLGFMASRGSRDLRIGIIAALACFMWGAASGHIYQMVTAHDFAPGNAGVMFWCDIFMPLFGIFLLWKTRKPQAI